jgi:hypothetical protein
MSEMTPNPIGKLDNAVRQEIFRLTGQFVAEGDPSRDAALVMVAGLFLGPSETAVAEITGCPVAFVSVIAARLRASGLWIDGAVEYADWFALGNLGVAHFALDLDVAEGIFVRTGAKENGQFEYRLVGDEL